MTTWQNTISLTLYTMRSFITELFSLKGKKSPHLHLFFITVKSKEAFCYFKTVPYGNESVLILS